MALDKDQIAFLRLISMAYKYIAKDRRGMYLVDRLGRLIIIEKPLVNTLRLRQVIPNLILIDILQMVRQHENTSNAKRRYPH